MFNGIIKNTGKLHKIYKKNNNCIIVISSKMKFRRDYIGSSISCSGVCLTLESYKKNFIKFYLSKETLNKTNFKYVQSGNIINLEKPMKFGDTISGHFVQGHVDTTCQVKKIQFIGKSWEINFKLMKRYIHYLIPKGSIAINGVSLTIAKIFNNEFKIAIIPKTLKLTNLAKLKKNDYVNVEFDIIRKINLSKYKKLIKIKK